MSKKRGLYLGFSGTTAMAGCLLSLKETLIWTRCSPWYTKQRSIRGLKGLESDK